jgi:hypothetical protein
MSLGWPFKLIIEKAALSDRNEKLTKTIKFPGFKLSVVIDKMVQDP